MLRDKLRGPARKIWGLLRANRKGEPRVAGAEYRQRVAAEKATYHDVEVVHDLPPIFHYWSNKYLVPKLAPFGFNNPDEFFVAQLLESWSSPSSGPKRFISIGAGNCDTEVRIARRLVDLGHRDFTIECLDLNPAMLDRGREEAARAEVAGQVVPVEGDFNRWKPSGKYDVVMASQSLHHVLELEHLFDSVAGAIAPEGRFAIHDMIGRNGHMRWPESKEVVDRFWTEMPQDHRYNRQLRRHEERFEDWDCSVSGFEGIRAQDILPLLVQRFSFELFIGFSNAVDPFVDRSFGPSFDVNDPADIGFIDRVEAADEALIRAGTLKPTHMMAVVTCSPNPRNLRCIGSLTPRSCVRDPQA